MDKVKASEGAKINDPSKRRTINPAVLGVSSSHGVKLSSTMTSQDKIELLSKLEEWRKARKEKLANTILAKQKQVEKPKAFPVLPPKDRASVIGHSAGDLNSKETVFERLYKNTAKTKKSENTKPIKSPPPIFKSKIPKVRISMPGNLKPLSTNSTVKANDAVSVINSNESLKNMDNNEKEITVDIPEQKDEVCNEKVSKPNEILSYEVHEVEVSCEVSSQEHMIESPLGGIKEEKILEETSEMFFEEQLTDSYKGVIEKKEENVFNPEIIEIGEDTKGGFEEFTNVTSEEPIKEESITNLKEMAETICVIQKHSEEQENLTAQEIFEETKADSVEREEIEEETQSKHDEVESEQEKILNTEESEKTFSVKPESRIEENNEQTSSSFSTSQVLADEAESENLDNHKFSNLTTHNDEKLVESISEKKAEFKRKSEFFGIKKPITKILPKKLEIKKSFSSVKGRVSIKSQPVKPVDKEKPKLRRSVSMLYRSKRSTEPAIHRTFSEKSLHELEKKEIRPLSPFLESELETNYKTPAKTVCFNTPKNTKLLPPSLLRDKLEDWLKNNGHPLESYRHLRCFGVTTDVKPFVRTPAKVNKTKRETLHRLVSPKTPVDDSDKENLTPPTAIKTVEDSDVENWLTELYRLITELKYPSERCEEWLAAIRSKCATCSQMPVYWECLAALNESKGGNKTSDQKKIAESEGDSLADLFDKMVIEQQKPSKPKLENGIDPKNIFKSTVFKFALQQKPLKESTSNSQEQLVATPVRRSSRIQKTPHKPYVVTSLHSLTPEVREKVKFKPNQSLIS